MKIFEAGTSLLLMFEIQEGFQSQKFALFNRWIRNRQKIFISNKT